MTMGCPSTLLIGSVTMRASVSTGPPAGKGATQVIGRLGKSSAIATNDTMGKAAAPAAKRIIGRRGSCMMFSHWLARLAAGSAEGARRHYELYARLPKAQGGKVRQHRTRVVN